MFYIFPGLSNSITQGAKIQNTLKIMGRTGLTFIEQTKTKRINMKIDRKYYFWIDQLKP